MNMNRIIAALVVALVGLLTVIQPSPAAAQGGFSLRFSGAGSGDIDRVKIAIDNPADTRPGPPADIGATDFTIEFWLRAEAAENGAAAVSCGANVNWIYGNIVLDRDRYNRDRKYGLALAGGRVVFGVSGAGTGDRTICGTTSVTNGAWHHVAVQRRRSDGYLWLYVDGRLEAEADGPDGDISYPDDAVPGNFCGPAGNQPCTNSDPFLVIGAEKHDAGPNYPSFSGWIDELRLSTSLRYSGQFNRPGAPFVGDGQTAALYSFDEGSGERAGDRSGATGGPSDGVLRLGGDPAGPVWSTLVPWGVTAPTATRTSTPIPATPTRTVTPSPPPTRTTTPTPTAIPAANPNLLLNPGFELASNGTNPDSWIQSSRFTQSNASVRSGSFAGRHRSTSNSSYTISQTISGISAGAGYDARGWVNIPATSDSFSFRLRVVWQRSDGTNIRTDVVNSFSAGTAGWVEAVRSLTAPSGATRARFQMSVTSLNATVYVDDLVLRRR